MSFPSFLLGPASSQRARHNSDRAKRSFSRRFLSDPLLLPLQNGKGGKKTTRAFGKRRVGKKEKRRKKERKEKKGKEIIFEREEEGEGERERTRGRKVKEIRDFYFLPRFCLPSSRSIPIRTLSLSLSRPRHPRASSFFLPPSSPCCSSVSRDLFIPSRSVFSTCSGIV